ncbi:MAG: Maf-like protein [Gammaproteobacteria bacterium]|nr:Maf-like protein [Gammaproteobacteria bacterium]MDH5799383.1 Maf-like protein [Gammaproteobacteria bacterium]
MTSPEHRIVLASTSPYRQQLLQKLALAFSTDSPEVDEAPLPKEPPEQMVTRLAHAKALAVAPRHPQALIIGSDQTATFDKQVLGKPGSHEKAVQQLSQMSGKSVVFYTGLCLLNSATGDYQLDCVPFTVHFRKLSGEQIERYLTREKPYHCAGSFKSEGLGISLFEKLEGDDPNTLIGLPLIRLVQMLDRENIRVP